MNQFVYYPKCSTCIKAKKYLEANGILCTYRDIKENPLSKDELHEVYIKSGLPLKRLFNTNGLVYRELNIKERINELSDDEQLSLLASNGMLVKRPIFIGNQEVLIGFKEESYNNIK